MEKLLSNLYAGIIDFFIVIGEFPSDIIRNLTKKYKDVRLVDLHMKNHDQFIQRKPYYLDATLNTRLLSYKIRDTFSIDNQGEFLPIFNAFSAYTDNHPHIRTYQFYNCLLTSNGNRMVNNYNVIRGLYRRLYNNRRIGLGHLPENVLQRHIRLGPIDAPLAVQPEVKDFYKRIKYNPEWI